MTDLKIRGLYKKFKDKNIFQDFNIDFIDENINCIIGESGIGKSTLLNMISGLENIDSGKIIGVNKDDISYIFQESRLVPWLTVKNNIELFIYDYYTKENAESEINKIFKLLNISGIENEYPEKLSGGMKQRVNIARALLKPSKMVLMDEPFKSLDYKTKYSIMYELSNILKNEKRTVIFVTHDVDEAIFLADYIYVFGGRPLKIKGRFTGDLKERKNEIINLI